MLRLLFDLFLRSFFVDFRRRLTCLFSLRFDLSINFGFGLRLRLLVSHFTILRRVFDLDARLIILAVRSNGLRLGTLYLLGLSLRLRLWLV